MSYFVNKHFLFWYAVIVLLFAFLVRTAWPSMDYYSHAAFLILLIAASIGLLICLIGMGGHVILHWKQKRREIEANYPLPLSGLSTTKVAEDRPVLQRPRPMQRQLHRRPVARLRGAKSQGANLQKPVAMGYRPPSNAVANPQNTHLQTLDDIDERIIAAGQSLQAQNIKVTGIAIANVLSDIPQRTVYDRLAKLRDRQTQ